MAPQQRGHITMNGSCALIYKTLAGLVLILLSPPVSLAQTREVVFPAADSSLVGDAGSLVFSQDGKLGFALPVKNTLSSAQLFCFSVEQGSVIDSVDLAPDFGTAQIGQQPPIIFIKAVTRPSIILAYGRDTSGNQRVLALPYDASGHLSRNWAQSFPNGGVFPSGSDLATSADGSRVFVLYTDAGLPTALNHLALLDAGNGAVLA